MDINESVGENFPGSCAASGVRLQMASDEDVPARRAQSEGRD